MTFCQNGLILYVQVVRFSLLIFSTSVYNTVRIKLIQHDNVMDLMIKITGRNIIIKDNVSVSS